LNNYRIFETVQFQKDLKHIALSGHRKITRKLLDFVYPFSEILDFIDPFFGESS